MPYAHTGRAGPPRLLAARPASIYGRHLASACRIRGVPDKTERLPYQNTTCVRRPFPLPAPLIVMRNVDTAVACRLPPVQAPARMPRNGRPTPPCRPLYMLGPPRLLCDRRPAGPRPRVRLPTLPSVLPHTHAANARRLVRVLALAPFDGQGHATRPGPLPCLPGAAVGGPYAHIARLTPLPSLYAAPRAPSLGGARPRTTPPLRLPLLVRPLRVPYGHAAPPGRRPLGGVRRTTPPSASRPSIGQVDAVTPIGRLAPLPRPARRRGHATSPVGVSLRLRPARLRRHGHDALACRGRLVGPRTTVVAQVRAGGRGTPRRLGPRRPVRRLHAGLPGQLRL